MQGVDQLKGAIGRARTAARPLTECVVRVLPVIPWTVCVRPACGLLALASAGGLVASAIAGRGVVSTVPEAFRAGFSRWSRVLGIDAVGRPPHFDFADESCARLTSRYSPDWLGVTLAGVVFDLVGEVYDQLGSLCQVGPADAIGMKHWWNARQPGSGSGGQFGHCPFSLHARGIFEPPCGIEPQTYALRVTSGTFTGAPGCRGSVRRRVAESVNDRCLGCSVGCFGSRLGKTVERTQASAN